MMMEAQEVFSRIVEIYEEGSVMPTCAWCGRVRVDDAWVVPPPAAIAAIDERNTLSHSVCNAFASRGAPA
jgi:hypothetical protein